MGDLPRVAVVIPTWNGREDLRDCLASLERGEAVETEVFVVDNGSEDGTGELLRLTGVPHVSLPSNRGFAAAVNLGVSRTSSPLVMVLNEDTLLEPDCLYRLASGIGADDSLGGLQPLVLQLERGAEQAADDPDTVVYSHGQSLTRDGRAREDGAGRPRSRTAIERREIFGVCGAACMLRREMLDRTGGYDESYFAFYEDVDLNVRARIAGWRFALEPEAVVWHVGNAAWRAGFKRPGADNARLVARNRLATQIKYMPLRAIPRIVAIEAGSLGRALASRRLGPTLAGKMAALRRGPELLRERRLLAAGGDPKLARAWLGVGWAQGRVGQKPHPSRPLSHLGRESSLVGNSKSSSASPAHQAGRQR